MTVRIKIQILGRNARNVSNCVSDQNEVLRKSCSLAPTHSSQHSLIHNRSLTAVTASRGSQAYEMTGALRDAGEDEEEDVDSALSLPRRQDTETGGRLQASGLEVGQLHRRATVPMRASNVSGPQDSQQV